MSVKIKIKRAANSPLEGKNNSMKTDDSSKKNFIASRREGRIIAFQSIYTYEFENRSIDSLLKFDWLDGEYGQESIEYAKKIIIGTISNIEQVDEAIKSKLINWEFERISLIDKSILRFSVYSMLFDEESLPGKIIINEAIEIVKKFGADDSYKFINGILDAIRKDKEKQKKK